jgi:hypothetical protein
LGLRVVPDLSANAVVDVVQGATVAAFATLRRNPHNPRSAKMPDSRPTGAIAAPEYSSYLQAD